MVLVPQESIRSENCWETPLFLFVCLFFLVFFSLGRREKSRRHAPIALSRLAKKKNNRHNRLCDTGLLTLLLLSARWKRDEFFESILYRLSLSAVFSTAIRVAKTMIGAKVITLCLAIFASFLEFRTRTRCLQSVSSAFFHLGNRAEISHTNPGGNWSPSTGLMGRGVKVTHPQIHIRELKQRRRRRQQERQKSNWFRLAKQQLCTCITLFGIHFFAVVARLRRESAFFHVLSRMAEHKTTTFFFFSWTLTHSFRIQLQKNLSTLILGN